jgi:excisionase family DNA binding protein
MSINNTNKDGLLDDNDACNYFNGIPKRTLRDWRKKRGLPYLKLTGKVVRYRRADLDKWCERHSVATIN